MSNLKKEEIEFGSEEEYVQWAQNDMGYKGDPDPKEVTKFLLGFGLRPIIDEEGLIYIKAWEAV